MNQFIELKDEDRFSVIILLILLSCKFQTILHGKIMSVLTLIVSTIGMNVVYATY